ncbi:STXBP unc-18 S1 [Asimina triloba]
MSDSDSSHGDVKTFRQITRDREFSCLSILLIFVNASGSLEIPARHCLIDWQQVLIMDKVTVKVMSYSCKMADITEEGVSLVEDLAKRRQPLPLMDAIYFIQPLLEKAYVFFSSPISKDLGFVTENEMALEELFGESAEYSHKYNACLNTMATRIATVFASMRELPFVRYRAAKSSLDASTMTTLRDVVPTKLAAGVWNVLMKLMKSSVQTPSKSGNLPERKEVLLEDHDPIWLELRHLHIADASERLHVKMTNFITKNKAAQIHHGSRDGGELSTRDLQKMVQALPQYSDQIDKLSLHVDIAGKINQVIREHGLRELGQLEQDLVFGDAGTKDVINFLRTNQEVSRENRLRLLMIYAAIYPEKFEADKGLKLMQLARLPSDDMNAVKNMRYLAGSESKKTSGVFSLKFDGQKKKHAARKERTEEEETWQLSRFYPIIEELIEKLSKGELPKDEYPCLNDPSTTIHGANHSTSVRTTQGQPPHSVRSRHPAATWARPRNSDDGYSSDSILKHASSDFKKMGQRIFVFIIGGATRSELRVIHKLSRKLNREVVLGSSSLDDPPQFITTECLSDFHMHASGVGSAFFQEDCSSTFLGILSKNFTCRDLKLTPVGWLDLSLPNLLYIGTMCLGRHSHSSSSLQLAVE